jgi:16S rRNA (cytidine1402-2'-O)-methyltransferase
MRAVTGVLFLVGTPIGNLGDLTERARATLADADLVAAEDTRRTGRLLQHLGIERPLLSVFEGNERERVAPILDALREGRDVALVTDAGMPSVSDPGYRLVRACAEEGLEVRVVPGPSSVTAALVVSGLPTDRFVFEGFLPRKAGDRRDRVAALVDERRTIVLFESPNRVSAALRELADAFGADRPAALCRELTKLHEEVVRGSLEEIAASLGDTPPKGEIVLVIAGRTAPPRPSVESLVAEARALVDEGTRKREAAAAVAARHGVGANEIYRALIERPAAT